MTEYNEESLQQFGTIIEKTINPEIKEGTIMELCVRHSIHKNMYVPIKKIIFIKTETSNGDNDIRYGSENKTLYYKDFVENNVVENNVVENNVVENNVVENNVVENNVVENNVVENNVVENNELKQIVYGVNPDWLKEYNKLNNTYHDTSSIYVKLIDNKGGKRNYRRNRKSKKQEKTRKNKKKQEKTRKNKKKQEKTRKK